jgi:spore maturation protein B
MRRAPAAYIGDVFTILDAVSRWAIPLLIAIVPAYAWARRVDVYNEFLEGAKEGIDLGVRILPYVVSIFVALGIFRASGAMDLMAAALRPLLDRFGVPGEVLPLMLIRPLSGSGALGITAELLRRWGPDSYIGRLASTMQGSTDTTFYVLSVYFGSVGIKKIRHALWLGLLADLAGFVASVIVVQAVFGR